MKKNKATVSIDLDKISYKDIKMLTLQQKEEFAKFLREKILNTCKDNGGHLTSNLGVIELTIALMNNFDIEKDDVLFDVGHQSYTYKILTGRDISHIRTKDGAKAFQSMKESTFDRFEAGHSSTSISFASAFDRAKILNNDDSYTIAVIGDSSIVSGIAFEAINNIKKDPKSKLIIVINDNGMGISKPIGGVENKWVKLRNSNFYYKGSSRFKNLFSKSVLTRWFYRWMKNLKDHFKAIVLKDNFIESLDFNYLGPINGHNLTQLDKTFQKAKKMTGPVFIHIITKKGKGYDFTENDTLGKFHGVSPSDFNPNEVKDTSKIALSKAVVDELEKDMFNDEKMVIINPAMVYGTHMTDLFKNYPDRTYDVGICEEHAVTFAGGFALKKMHPVVSIYSTFMQRSYDEIIHDVAKMHLPVLFLVDHAGLVGPDGETHQGIYDVAFLNSIPDVNCFMPYSLSSLKKLMAKDYFSLNRPTFIRITRDDVTLEEDNEEFIFNSSKKLLISVGPRGYELNKKVKTYDTFILEDLMPTKEYLLSKINNLFDYEEIVFVDKYSIYEGTASIILEILNSLHYQGNYKTYTIKKEYIPQASIDEQLEAQHLDDKYLLEKLGE